MQNMNLFLFEYHHLSLLGSVGGGGALSLHEKELSLLDREINSATCS